MDSYRAFRVHSPGAYQGRVETLAISALRPAPVLVRVAYSSLNYKDALAISGQGRILKTHPLTPGIDLAGHVVESADPRFAAGDSVLLTGCGTGENHDGGYSELQRVDPDTIVPLPPALTLREAMLLGTAGFTAALCVHRMEQMGQEPSRGPIVVTGASGGVGSFAISILAARGYEIIALSAKPERHNELKLLGAHTVMVPEALALGDKPLESIRFGGAIDNVGGTLLSQILAATELWGNIACVGLAASPKLEATVMPLILRGVSLLGISSNNTPMPLRRLLWQNLSGAWRPKALETILSAEIGLDDLTTAAKAMLDRQTHGRILVRCSPNG